MLYVVAVVAGLIAGFLLHSWAIGLPDPSPVSHDYCDERFNRMHKRMRHEIQVREDEIQRLIHGDGLCVEQPVRADEAANERKAS